MFLNFFYKKNYNKLSRLIYFAQGVFFLRTTVKQSKISKHSDLLKINECISY